MLTKLKILELLLIHLNLKFLNIFFDEVKNTKISLSFNLMENVWDNLFLPVQFDMFDSFQILPKIFNEIVFNQ